MRSMLRSSALGFVLACSSAPKQQATTTSEPPPPAPEATTTTAAATTTSQPAQPTTVTVTTTTTAPPPATQPASPPPTTPATGSKAKPAYSCFSYVAVNGNKKHHVCMRTANCPDYLEQVKGLKGIRELTGCANVASVWCFQQYDKLDDKNIDYCQPTLDDCKGRRDAAIKNGESVRTDCAQDS